MLSLVAPTSFRPSSPLALTLTVFVPLSSFIKTWSVAGVVLYLIIAQSVYATFPDAGLLAIVWSVTTHAPSLYYRPSRFYSMLLIHSHSEQQGLSFHSKLPKHCFICYYHLITLHYILSSSLKTHSFLVRSEHQNTFRLCL